MTELNLLTQKLLAEGYTKDNPPDFVKPWNPFYGGFEYTLQAQRNLLFETPCGLQVKGSYFGGGNMSYMGIDWMIENGNPVVRCPYNKLGCEKNHELLREIECFGYLVQCACRETKGKYDYEKSIDKAFDLKVKRERELFEDFKRRKNGRVCSEMCHFNESEGKWEQFYDPVNICSKRNCQHCFILNRELSKKKGNVFYDLKTIRANTESSLFNTGDIVTITKGKRLFDKNCSLDICEIVASKFQDKITRREEMRNYQSLFFAEYHDIKFEFEVLNVRAERRVSRDLEQDLEDIRNGFTVLHDSDLKEQNRQDKRENRQKAVEAKVKKYKKMVSQFGFKALETIDQRRIEKLIEREQLSWDELKECQTEFERKQRQQQITLFD